MSKSDQEISEKVISDFGKEWKTYDQRALSQEEMRDIFNSYFAVFPKSALNGDSVGADFGGGTGRWAFFVAQEVSKLFFVEPSEAMEVAKEKLSEFENISFQSATIEEMAIEDNSLDFGYSLGVLHHIPDTQTALDNCVSKLRPGAPFLVYLYYNFEDRPFAFRALWHLSNPVRRLVSSLPEWSKIVITNLIAVTVYYPLARFSKALEKSGFNVRQIPLSFYRNSSLYTMRTDARDRFGTTLEKRFSRAQIESMMHKAGLSDVQFSPAEPYWCAVGFKS